MGISFDFQKMERLLSGFYNISGIRYSLADTHNNLLCFSSDFASFCNSINSLKSGHERCKKCDFDAISSFSDSNEKYITYRCHAGLLETVLPIKMQGETIAYIFFGQMRYDDPNGEQWEETKKSLNWHPDPDLLKEQFEELMIVDDTLINSCAEILFACSSYICLEGIITSSKQTDLQVLTSYIEKHYNHDLTLEVLSKNLSMSKTKLCSLAASKNTTVMSMIADKQMSVAKSFLTNTTHTISEISELCGIKDYNYFTKIFKKNVGYTPSQYRKMFFNSAK